MNCVALLHLQFTRRLPVLDHTQPLTFAETMRPTHSRPSLKAEEWTLPHSEYVLPSNTGPATYTQPLSVSSERSPSINASPLVDRPPPQQRKRGKLPKETTDYLKAWLHRHSDHPYPSEEEKKQLCLATGLSMSQVSNWMINVCIVSPYSLDYR